MNTKTTLMVSVSSIIILFAGWRAWKFFAAGSGDVPLAGVLMVDIENGKHFTLDLDRSIKSWPVKSPFTGKMMGYPAEVCYWGGCKKLGGTWVVLNETKGEPGPTKCPVCGHEVIPHNPVPPDFYGESAHKGATTSGQSKP